MEDTMPIQTTPDGSIIATGPHATRAFAHIALANALELETRLAGSGMRITRGPSMLSRAKKWTGLRTNNRALHADKLRDMAKALIASESVS
jgi:hypothetical protein